MIEVSLNYQVMRPAQLVEKMEKIFKEHGMKITWKVTEG
jgi:hypothetical protein